MKHPNTYFTLDPTGTIPIETDDVLVWSRWYEDNDPQRIVSQEQVGDYWISTVFMGVNHNFRSVGPPLLWETMVFDKARESIYCDRYPTHEQARIGHQTAVDLARTGRLTEDNDEDGGSA